MSPNALPAALKSPQKHLDGSNDKCCCPHSHQPCPPSWPPLQQSPPLLHVLTLWLSSFFHINDKHPPIFSQFMKSLQITSAIELAAICSMPSLWTTSKSKPSIIFALMMTLPCFNPSNCQQWIHFPTLHGSSLSWNHNHPCANSWSETWPSWKTIFWNEGIVAY